MLSTEIVAARDAAKQLLWTAAEIRGQAVHPQEWRDADELLRKARKLREILPDCQRAIHLVCEVFHSHELVSDGGFQGPSAHEVVEDIARSMWVSIKLVTEVPIFDRACPEMERYVKWVEDGDFIEHTTGKSRDEILDELRPCPLPVAEANLWPKGLEILRQMESDILNPPMEIMREYRDQIYYAVAARPAFSVTRLEELIANEGRRGDETWRKRKSESSIPQYLGDGCLIFHGERIRFDNQEELVLQALVELGAATKHQLNTRSGVQDSVTILKRILRKWPLLQSEGWIVCPGGKGKGGYRTSIRTIAAASH